MEMKPLFFNANDFKRLSKTSRDSLRQCGYIPVSVPNPENINTLPDNSLKSSELLSAIAAGLLRQTDMTKGDILKEFLTTIKNHKIG